MESYQYSSLYRDTLYTVLNFYPCFKTCFFLQVRKAGETVVVAGVATMAVLGVVALAGALFGGSKKENKNTQ